MKRKCEALFGVSNIKSILQLDDDVGKMAKATPAAFSKALELFIQDLCDRAYDFTLRNKAKAMTSHHLKSCIEDHPMFDFLKDVVSHVPDPQTNRRNSRQRKAIKGDKDDICKTKQTKMDSLDNKGSGSKGCSGGRGKSKIIEESIEPAKPKENEEISLIPEHNAENSELQGKEFEEHILALINESDKIFQPEEDYDCED